MTESPGRSRAAFLTPDVGDIGERQHGEHPGLVGHTLYVLLLRESRNDEACVPAQLVERLVESVPAWLRSLAL